MTGDDQYNDDKALKAEQTALSTRMQKFTSASRLIEKVGGVFACALILGFVISFIHGPPSDDSMASRASAPYIPKKMRQIHYPGEGDTVHRPSGSQLEARGGLLDKIAGTTPSDFSEAEKVYLRAQVCSYSVLGGVKLECDAEEDTRWLVEHGEEVKAFANPVIMGILEEGHLGGLQSVVTADIARARAESRFEGAARFSHALSSVSPFIGIPILLWAIAFIRMLRGEAIRRRLWPLGAALSLPSRTPLERMANGLFAAISKRQPQDSAVDQKRAYWSEEYRKLSNGADRKDYSLPYKTMSLDEAAALSQRRRRQASP